MSQFDSSAFWMQVEARRGVISEHEAVVEELSQESTIVTPELLNTITETIGSHFGASHFSTKNLSTFIARLTATLNPRSILDPTCGSGYLLNAVASQFEGAVVHGVEIDRRIAQIAENLLGDRGRVFTGNTFNPSLDLNPLYDLIVAEPPFGQRMREPVTIDGYAEPLRGDFHEILACWVGQRLTKNGRAFIIMPGGFVWSHRAKRCKATMNTVGTAITAYIHIPGGSLQGTQIDAYVVILERKPQGEVFVAQYTPDQVHQEKLIENLLAHKQGGHAAQGRIVNHKNFRGYSVIEAREKLQRVVRRTSFLPIPMQDLVVEARRFRPNQEFKDLPEFPNSVFLPRLGRMPAVTHRDQIKGSVTHYYELAINPDLADARFVARMFSQQLGQYVLNTIRRGPPNYQCTLDDLMATDFYLPTLDDQRRVLVAQDSIVTLRSEINELEDALWDDTSGLDKIIDQIQTVNQDDRFEDWLETLPFPLASILWRYRASTGSARAKYEILLHFFEALAEFLATIHLSAFSSDPELWVIHGSELKEVLARQNLTFHTASFGLWKCVVEFLGSRCRTMAQECPDVCSNLYRTQNSKVLAILTDTTIIQCLQEANAIRNTWLGHVGAIGERQAAKVHAELDALIQICRGVFGRLWNQYELVKPVECRFNQGVFSYQVRCVTGTRTPFTTTKRECIEAMEDESLYLFDPDGNRGLQLLPFVKLMPSPQSEVNACYFYSRKVASGESRYVSYHCEEEADYTAEFPELSKAMDRLDLVSTC